MSDQETTWSESPETPELEAPPPAWPKVVGIISIVWGALGLACGLLFRVGGSWVGRWGLEQGLNQQGRPLDETEIPLGMGLTPIIIAVAVIGAVVSGLLLFAGLSCVGRVAKARTLHIVYGFLAILHLAIATVIAFQQQAEMQQWMKDYPDSLIAQQQGGAGMQSTQMIIGIVILVLLLVWPLFCIFWFGAAGRKPEVGKPEVL